MAMVRVWVEELELTRVAGKVRVAGVMASRAGVIPVPVSAAVTVETPLVELEAVRKPVLLPERVGLKVMAAVQVAEAARVVEQVVDRRENGPETESVKPARELTPGLEMVIDWVMLEEPTAVVGKLRLVGVRTRAAGVAPVPLRETETGFRPRVEVVTVTAPACGPAMVGLKRTGTEQEAPAKRVPVHVPVPTEKGDAVEKPRPVRGPVPGLETVMDWAVELAPRAMEPKERLAGVTVSWAAGRPVPVNPTTTGI